jgi:hypothetical protein
MTHNGNNTSSGASSSVVSGGNVEERLMVRMKAKCKFFPRLISVLLRISIENSYKVFSSPQTRLTGDKTKFLSRNFF